MITFCRLPVLRSKSGGVDAMTRDKTPKTDDHGPGAKGTVSQAGRSLEPSGFRL